MRGRAATRGPGDRSERLWATAKARLAGQLAVVASPSAHMPVLGGPTLG